MDTIDIILSVIALVIIAKVVHSFKVKPNHEEMGGEKPEKDYQPGWCPLCGESENECRCPYNISTAAEEPSTTSEELLDDIRKAKKILEQGAPNLNSKIKMSPAVPEDHVFLVGRYIVMNPARYYDIKKYPDPMTLEEMLEGVEKALVINDEYDWMEEMYGGFRDEES